MEYQTSKNFAVLDFSWDTGKIDGPVLFLGVSGLNCYLTSGDPLEVESHLCFWCAEIACTVNSMCCLWQLLHNMGEWALRCQASVPQLDRKVCISIMHV